MNYYDLKLRVDSRRRDDTVGAKEERAALNKHCANNFDRALIALKQWQEAYDVWCNAKNPSEVEFPDSHALIAELETAEKM